MQLQAFPFAVKMGICPFLIKDYHYIASLILIKPYVQELINHAVTLIKRALVQ